MPPLLPREVSDYRHCEGKNDERQARVTPELGPSVLSLNLPGRKVVDNAVIQAEALNQR
jgi:hypothetical protein